MFRWSQTLVSATIGWTQSPDMTPAPEHRSETVYRRSPDPNLSPTPALESLRARTRGIAPAVTPLIIGSLVLLALILGLGWWSNKQMDELSFEARDFEMQHSARLTLLLNLRLLVTQVDNEARARSQAESRREFVPPFDLRLGHARDKVKGTREQLARPPLSEEPKWIQLQQDLEPYLKETEQVRSYSLYGFERFKKVDNDLNDLLLTVQQRQATQQQHVMDQQQNAKRSVQLWSVIALLFGVLVTAGTVWEVQRRFRETRSSLSEAQRERTFTSQLLEGMVSAVAAVDEEDKIRSANAAFFKIFPGASIGASVLEPLAPPETMKMLSAATSTRVNRATYRGRWLAHVDDEDKTFDVYSSPLAIDGDRGQIVTLVDATEVAASELALRRTESLAAVGQATTQVAHEIRNPLGSIRLGVSMLRDSVTDQDGLNTIELVERGIKHLNKLVVDVTQFSRQKTLERSSVDLREVLERSIDLVSERIRDKNAIVERDFLGDPIVGRWDADQLRQVFVNVIANAVDASPDGGEVKISTDVLRIDGTPGGVQPTKTYAQIKVIDRGKGMDKATRDRIFEPFFTTKKRGTGLGLAIVKQIVELHGGSIRASSEPGQGSQFVIELPL